jgi:hypothetical protein
MRAKPLVLLHPLFFPGAGCVVAKAIPRTSSSVLDAIYSTPQIRMAEPSSKANATRCRPFRPVADARFPCLVLAVPGPCSAWECCNTRAKPSLQPRRPSQTRSKRLRRAVALFRESGNPDSTCSRAAQLDPSRALYRNPPRQLGCLLLHALLLYWPRFVKNCQASPYLVYGYWRINDTTLAGHQAWSSCYGSSGLASGLGSHSRLVWGRCRGMRSCGETIRACFTRPACLQ